LNLLIFNRHWNKDFRYNFPLERHLLASLKQHTTNRQIIELTGLRRTGKTTLFFQLINHLLNQGTDALNIWYYSFDQARDKLDALLSEFCLQTKKDYQKDRIYIFLDEIQKLDDFQSQLKIYYDIYPEIKFFISGSTSLFIKKKTQESLAGRLFSFTLKPLSFQEYLLFSRQTELIEFPEMYQHKLSGIYVNYQSCQFIETIGIPNEESKKEYIIGILKKLIFEDIPQNFSVDNPEILYALIKIVAQQPGMYLHYENLGNDLKISSKTLSKYISILEQAFLLKIAYNYTGNQLTSEKKLKRLYLTSTSFCTALHSNVKTGLLIENTVISSFPQIFFWRDAYKHEVDLVKFEGEKAIPVEIKFKSQINRTDFQNLYLFAKKFGTEKALLLTNQIETNTIDYKEIKIEVQSLYLTDLAD
jgi:uncharacterized protein